MNIIFVRHGDPDYEKDSLTEKGFREASMLTERIDKINVTKFYCSPLGRAKDTAKAAMKNTGKEPEILEFMREFRAPIINPHTNRLHVPWDFMPEYWTVKDELYDPNQWRYSDVMQTGDVAEESLRVEREFDELLKEYGYYRNGRYYEANPGSDATIVIFCHLGAQCLVLAHLMSISPVVLWQSCFLAPTSVTVVTTEERIPGKAAFRCRKIGDTSHLYANGEPDSDSGLFPRNSIQV